MSEEVAPGSDRPCTAEPVANCPKEACCKAHRFKQEVLTFKPTLPCGICRAFWEVTCNPPSLPKCLNGNGAEAEARPAALHGSGSLNCQGRQSSCRELTTAPGSRGTLLSNCRGLKSGRKRDVHVVSPRT